MKRTGYTLVELLISTSVFVIVAGGLGTFFIGVQRLAVNAFSDAELTVRTREFRERLLFRADRPGPTAIWTGVLSGSPVNETSKVVDSATSKIRMSAYGANPADGRAVDQTITLARADGADGRGNAVAWLVNEAASETGAGWLRPGGFGFLEDGYLDADFMNDRHILFFNVSAKANGRVRRERIVIPLFGTVQVKNSDHVFNDR